MSTLELEVEVPSPSPTPQPDPAPAPDVEEAGDQHPTGDPDKPVAQ